MRKGITTILLLALFIPSYLSGAEAKNENIKTVSENADCKLEKGVKIILSPENDVIPGNKDAILNSVISLIDKRLKLIDSCYRKIDLHDDKITVILPAFAEPKNIAKFLTEKIELKIKEPVIDPATGQQKTEKKNEKDTVIWKSSEFSQNMIADAKMVEKKLPEKKFQVTIKLDEKGIKTFDNIAEKMMHQYFMIEIDDEKIGTIIIKNDKEDILGIPTLQKIPGSNALFLKNLTEEIAEKFKNKKTKLKFKESVISSSGSPLITAEDGQQHFVWKESSLKNAMIKDFKIDLQKLPQKPIQLSFKLNEKGTKILEEITARLIDKAFAIEINDRIISAPVIKEKISGGNFTITGDLSEELINNVINSKGKLKFKEPVIDQKTGEQKYNKNQPLWKDTLLSSEMILNITPQAEDDFNNTIKITLNQEGQKLFEELTEKFLNKPLGIEINGQIISAPIVNEIIKTGNFDIKLFTNKMETMQIAAQIKSGQPEISLKVIEVIEFPFFSKITK